MHTLTWAVLVWFALLVPSDTPTDESVKAQPDETASDEQSRQQNTEPPTSVLPTADTGPINGGQKSGVGDQETDQHNANEPPIAAPWPPLWHLIGDLAVAVFLAIFSGVQVWYGRRQWEAMADQNKIMQQQIAQAENQLRIAKASADATEKTVDGMRLQQRSWIAIESPSIEPLVHFQPIKLAFIAKNYGNPPAFVERAFIVRVIKTRQSPDRADEQMQTADNSAEKHPEDAWVVPPNALMAWTVTDLADVLIPGDVNGIKEGNTTLYFVLIVAYRDVTLELRKTKTCFVYAPDSGALRVHPKHNAMT